MPSNCPTDCPSEKQLPICFYGTENRRFYFPSACPTACPSEKQLPTYFFPFQIHLYCLTCAQLSYR
jgi:hypothetical protein